VFHVLGQPNDMFEVDRKAAARYQINVADVQDAINTAVGGNAFTQVLDGERRYDLVLRYLPQFRNTKEAIENIRLLSSPSTSTIRKSASAIPISISTPATPTRKPWHGGSSMSSASFTPMSFSTRIGISFATPSSGTSAGD
jgi:hypothetical protein